MSVNIEDPLAYELLSRVIDEFEKEALRTGRRDGILAVANGPLTAMETALSGSEQVLIDVRSARDVFVNGRPEQDAKKHSPKSIIEERGIDFDADLLEVFGGSDNPVQNYLEDCLDCNLRLNFDWQLKPLSLLDPINGFLDTINATIDKLLGRIDPFSVLTEICWALNHLKTLCPPDLILVLMSLKLLLKKYSLNIFNIKLDWTVLLGPLLKIIVDGITNLLDVIMRILLAPVDCVVGGLKATNNLFKEANQFVSVAKAFGGGVASFAEEVGQGKFPGELDGGLTVRDAQWIKPTDGLDNNGVPDAGKLNTSNRYSSDQPANTRNDAQAQTTSAFSYTTGFELRGDMTVSEALADPNFFQATFLEKLIIPIQEARNWIRELFDNILDSLRSLNNLVGNGLSLNLDFLGIMLFIADMISLVMMIIRMLKTNPNVNDWCSYLQENPELLEEQLRGRFGVDLSLEATGSVADGSASLLLRQGPKTVGVINTCISHRTQADADIINQWIADLKA